MKINKLIIIFFILIIGVAYNYPEVFAQNPPASTQAGAQQNLFEKEQKEQQKSFDEQERRRAKPEDDLEYKPPSVEEVFPKEEKKILVKHINVVGNIVVSDKELKGIIDKYENKELGINEIKMLCNEITTLYIRKSYITSGAYLPPQKIKDGIIEIRILEGRYGDITAEGNRHFRSALLESTFEGYLHKQLSLNDIEQSMRNLNEHPDRQVKAVLLPGKKFALTDIVLKVKEKNPWHMDYNWSNRGTKYTGKNRYSWTGRNTNFLGFDDFLTMSYQMSDRYQISAKSVDYNFPIGLRGTKMGLYGSQLHTDVGREFKDLDSEGRVVSVGAYINKSLIDTRATNADISLGFDYKTIRNYLFHEVSSRDELRIAKASISWDHMDAYGRTLLSNEFDFGIPKIIGGVASKDPFGSRTNAGGKFFKSVSSGTRIHRLPFSSILILTAKVQGVDNRLVSSEQIWIGGADTVRGYPELEFLGDYGFVTNAEIRMPAFLIPKFIKMPISQESVKDKLQFVFFADTGAVYTKNADPGVKKHNYLRGAGCGLRMNINDVISGRIDLGWPINKRASDAAQHQVYFSLSWNSLSDMYTPEQLAAYRVRKFTENLTLWRVHRADVKTVAQLNKDYQAGKELYDQGKLKEAVDTWKKITDKQQEIDLNVKETMDIQVEAEKQAKLDYDEGMKLYKLGKYEDAIVVWNKVLQGAQKCGFSH